MMHMAFGRGRILWINEEIGPGGVDWINVAENRDPSSSLPFIYKIG
jgi:hypothetical protein